MAFGLKKIQKSTLYPLLLGVAFSLIGLKGSYAQATYTSAQSGPWKATTTWSIAVPGSDSDNDGIPDSNDVAIVISPYTVDVSDGNMANSTHACQSLTINNGGTVRTNSGTFIRTLNVTNSLTIAAGGTLKVNDVGTTATHFFNIGGDFTNNGGTFTPVTNNTSLLVTFDGAGAQAINGTVATQTFNDVVVNKGGGTLTVGGSTNTLNVANFTETLGNFTAPTTFSATAAVTLTAGTFTAGTNTNVTGNFTNNGSTFSAGAGTVTLNGATQTIGGSSSTSFNNLTINTGTVTLGVATTANGTLTVATPGSLALSTFGFNSNGLLSITGTTISGTGTLKLTANAQSNANAATATISAPVSMLVSNQSFTVQPGSATPDLIVSSAISGSGFGFVKLGTGELTLSGANTFTGVSTLTAGTLNINSSTALGTGNFTISGGTIDNTSGSAITLTNNNTQNWNADFTFLGTQSLNMGTGSVLLNANRQVTISANTLTVGGTLSAAAYNFTKAGAGTLIFGANPVTLNSLGIVAGTFTAPSGTLNIAGDFTNGATFSHNGGTVNFNGGTQAIAGVTYSTLKTSTTGTKTAGGPITAATLDNGGSSNVAAILDMGANALTATTIDNTGATIRFSGASNGIAVSTGTIEYYGATQTVGTGTYSTLNITAAGTKTAGGPITAATLDNGGSSNVAAILDMGANALTATTIDNTGATIRFSGASNGLAISTGTVQYSGSTQTVAGGSYNNLTINESSGNASLNAAASVNGVLRLNAGNLILGSNNLSLGSAASILVTSPSASKMIVASGSGELQKTYSSTGSFTFPIGAGTTYSPIAVSVSAGVLPGYIGASVASGKHPKNASATNFLTRYWNINTSILSCIATLSASYISADVNGTETSIKSAQLNGNTVPWIKFLALGGNTLTVSGASISSSSITAFTGITGPDPTVSITGGGVTVCSGPPGASLMANPSSADIPLTYSWNPSADLSSASVQGPTATPTSTTNYTVTVTDANGITATNSTLITVNPLPTLTGASQAAAVCAGNGAVINLSGLVPSSTFTVNYTINSVVQTPVAGIVASSGGVGSFITPNLTTANNGQSLQITGVTITSALPNCNKSFTQNVTLNVDGLPVDETLSVTSPICYGSTTNVSVTTSEIGVNYQLRNNSNNSIIGSPVAGTGGLINLPAGALIATTAFNVLATNGATGCAIQLSVAPSIVVNGPLSLSEVSASHVNVVCNGGGTGVIVVSSTGGGGTYEYSKDGGLSWQPIGTFSGLVAGSYSIWVRDKVTPSCVYSGLAPITISQPSVLGLSEVSASHVNVVCHGGGTGVIVVSATGGAGTYEYSKDGGLSWQPIGTFSGLTAGSYSIWVRDAATPSCVYSGLAPIAITQPGALSLSEVSTSHVNVVCHGGSTGVIVVSATGGAGTYEYSKDGGLSWQSSGTFSGLTAGSYSIWVRDAAAVSCVYSGLGAIMISEPSLALALVETVASHVNVVCKGGATGVIVVSATGGAGTYEYSKDGGLSWQSSGTFSGLTAGSYSIWVRDAAAVSCVYSGLGAIVISEPSLALALVETVASHVNVVCNGGGTGVIVVSATGGAGTYEYSKDGVMWQSSGTFSGLTAGSYSIQVRDAAAVSCVYSGLAPITITQPASLTLVETVASHVNVVCNGGGTGVIVVSSTGGGGTYEYSKDGGLSWQPIGTFSGLVAGSYSIWVRDKVTPSCVYSGLAPITISQPSVLGLSEVSASHVNVVCHGGGTGVIVVSATGGAGTYEYSKDGGLSWQPIGTFSGLTAGSYSIWVRDAATPSCVYSGLAPIAITQPGALSLSEVSTSHVNVVCHGGSTGVIVVSATGGAGTYEYSKDGGLSWQSSGTFSGLTAGSYSIWVRDAAAVSCVYSGLGAIMISEPSLALALVETVASHVNVVCKGGATGVIVVSATGGAGTYEYSKDGGLSWQSSGTFSGLTAGSYSIWVRDAAAVSCVYSGLGAIVISEPSLALALVETVASHVNVVCNGGGTGVIVVSATGGAGTYEYSKDGVMWQSSGTFSGLTAGSYSIQVRDAAAVSCVYSGLAPITITQPASLTLVETVASHVNVVCNGGGTGVIVVSSTGGGGRMSIVRMED